MIEFLKSNRAIILILTTFFGLLGLNSLFSMPKEPTPSLNIPNYIMTVVYPGADPYTVEQQVVRKLENKLRSISYVKQVTSSSASSFGIINIEFLQKKSNNDAVNDIKSAVDEVFPTLPSDVKYPNFKKVDIADSPIYTFVIGSNEPTQKIYEKVKTLEDKVKGIQGVSDVVTIGKPTQQINVNIDYSKLNNFNLDVTTVTNILKSTLFKYPADKKDIKGSLYTFEVANYEDDIPQIVEKLLNTDIVNVGGKTVKVRDVAAVTSTYASSKNKSFLVTNDGAINTISMQVKKVPGEDIERITQEVKGEIESFKIENPGYTTLETSSQEESTKKMFDIFVESFFETAGLVFVIILVVFGFKSSIVILLSFLLSYAITFWFLKAIGYTFNNIVSFSLVLVLGIMVDNLIVITQGIIAGYKAGSKNVRDAIQYSLKNYGTAVIYGTMTTIATFAPLYWMLSGIIGEYMKPFPVTVISNLFFSIITSIIILPIIFVMFFQKDKKEFKTPIVSEKLDHFGEKLGHMFGFLNKTKWRSFGVVAIFWIIFAGSIALMGSGQIKSDFLPPSDSDNMWINIEYKEGITLDKNQQYTKEITDKIMQHIKSDYSKEVDSVSIDLGSERSSGSISSASNAGSANYSASSMTLKLVPGKQRTKKSYTLKDEFQNYLSQNIKGKYDYLKDITAIVETGGPGGGKPIAFNVLGDNVEEIGTYISVILPEIEKIDGIYNVATSIKYSNGKIKYILDEDKAKQLGINVNTAINSIMALQNSEYEPNGIKIGGLNQFGDDEIEIKSFLNFSGNIDDIKIGSGYLNQIIKRIELQPDLKALSKIDGQIAITIDADKRNEAALGIIQEKIDKIIKDNPMPKGLSYKAAGDIESSQQSLQDLGIALLTGLSLMYLILVALFKNIKYPTIILTSIFLCIAGVILILWMTGLTFSFPAQLGIFGVFGVGVNQAIIHLIDFKEFHEVEGLNTIDSFTKSIAKRFEPIFLTKLTTIIGLLILAYKDEVFGGMAIAFIGGLLMSFFVTLVYMPTLVRLISKD